MRSYPPKSVDLCYLTIFALGLKVEPASAEEIQEITKESEGCALGGRVKISI